MYAPAAGVGVMHALVLNNNENQRYRPADVQA